MFWQNLMDVIGSSNVRQLSWNYGIWWDTAEEYSRRSCRGIEREFILIKLRGSFKREQYILMDTHCASDLW